VAEHVIPLVDLVLVDRCLGGEASAARELFRAHQGRVHATLVRVLGGSADKDDLVQETFIQVFRSLHTFRGDARLSTWIDRIAVRVALRHLAAARRRPEALELDPDEVPGAIDPAAHVEARAGVRRLYAALAALGPASRVAFALFAIDGRSLRETASAMGAALSATKLRVWRARRALFRRAAADPVLAELLGEIDLEEDER
jgi:RNA polymerase sigma-70 factor (ECF subfamily)